MVLTKADLVRMLIQQIPSLSRPDAALFVEQFFEEVRLALEKGEEVKLPGFGNFTLRDKRGRPGRNPRTGEEVIISPRRVVTFHPSQKLRERIEEDKK